MKILRKIIKFGVLLAMCFIFFIALFPFLNDYLYTGSARVNATKSSHNTVLKFVAAEIGKCSLGKKTVMWGNLKCNRITPSYVAEASIKYFSSNDNSGIYEGALKKAYPPHDAAVKAGFSTADSDVGYIFIKESGSKIIITSCNKTPCNKKENLQESTIDINDIINEKD